MGFLDQTLAARGNESDLLSWDATDLLSDFGAGLGASEVGSRIDHERPRRAKGVLWQRSIYSPHLDEAKPE